MQKYNLQRFTNAATKPNLLIDVNPGSFDDDIGHGWSISPANPECIVRGFSHLHIKANYKLRAYQFSDGANGNGVVWAIPEGTDLPFPDQCDILDDHFLSAPKPNSALHDFMQAIDGDKTPLSYLQASIVFHELHEFGAMWHGTSWGRDVILPIHDDQDSDVEIYDWEMLEDKPEITEPHFYYNGDGNPVIVFHTTNDIGTVTWNRYVHIFNKDDYAAHVERTCIATAEGGIIF